MNKVITIGVIGDAPEGHPAHVAIDDALNHAAQYLLKKVDVTWLPTQSLTTSACLQGLERFDGVFCAPGGAYDSPDGAVAGIQYAREYDRPFLGT